MVFQVLALVGEYMRKIIILCAFFTILNSNIYAARVIQKSKTKQDLVTFSAKKSESLESESLESGLELRVLQARLDKLTTQNKINEASGGGVVFDNMHINLLSITLFGNQKKLQLAENGDNHEYNEGDYISPNIFIDKVNHLGIILRNKKTGEVKHILIDND